MAFAVVALELFACLGLGAATLRLLKIGEELRSGESVAFSLAVGFGLLGWLVFPLGVLGLLNNFWLFGLLIAGSAGVVLLRHKGHSRPSDEPDIFQWVLLALILVVMVFDVAEGLSPPADADTLAYHFTSPKHFLEAGRFVFILRPGDGAIPYLTHMTYLPAMALGGELALTLWAMVSGWIPALLLFVLSRRHLDLNWSLAVVLVFMTMPAVIFGAGTGQIEVRMAMFAMVAAWATARTLETGRLNYAVLAGLAVGFYGGSKYLGLLFAVACGLTILAQRRWLIHGLVFTAIAVAAGFQWYAWNGIHTGDPFFPVFFQWLGRDDLILWTKEQDLFYKTFFMNIDRPIPRTLLWFFLFPFHVTVESPPVIEAKFVGLGPYGLLAFPFAALGVWKFRHRILGSRLLIYAAIAFLFYALWFFSGPSQRVRHLIPVAPLFLLCFTVAAERLSAEGAFRMPFLAAILATIFFQLSVDAVFSIKYMRHVSSSEGREEFLLRNVKNYAPVPWINANLKKTDRLFLAERQLFYFLEIPYLFSSPNTQGAVSMKKDQKDPMLLYRQLVSVGITHILTHRANTENLKYGSRSLELLSDTGCMKLVKSFDTSDISSRTFYKTGTRAATFDLLKLGHNSPDCPTINE